MELRAKNYLKLSIFLLIDMFILFILCGYALIYLSPKYYLQLFIVGLAVVLFLAAVIALGTATIILGYRKRYIPKYMHLFIRKFIFFGYPLVALTCKIFKMDKRDLKLFLIDINNILVSSAGEKYDSKDIMLLTPHCLQDSTCDIKITNDVNNCKRCGKCNINSLIGIAEKYKIKFYVASGGTFARKVVMENKPRFIISIACERDLWSGIKDVGKIPVLGVVNNRPNGPCNNTKVECSDVEEMLKKFIRNN